MFFIFEVGGKKRLRVWRLLLVVDLEIGNLLVYVGLLLFIIYYIVIIWEVLLISLE